MAIKPIRVSQLNSYIRRILQSDPILGNVSVVGEISNLKYHGSGHVYFTLKDETSKINCFLPADQLRYVRFELSDGMEITASGYISVYERGGYYSLNIRDVTVEGMGNLSIAFEKLKEKLAAEGLFAPERKRPIPFFPRKVAVITSETGAAVRDIIKIIRSRNNIVDVLVYPCLVQGPAAAPDIVSAIDGVNERFPETDVIIVGRGGGSMEELWAFNEEMVARSISRSRIPVISAVGHETDFTIADFAADLRAETPTAAAQTAVPDLGALKEFIRGASHQLREGLLRRIRLLEYRVQAHSMEALSMKLQSRIQQNQTAADQLTRFLTVTIRSRITGLEHLVSQAMTRLEERNPSKILQMGYSMALDSLGHPVSSTAGFSPGDDVTVVMKDGILECSVKEIHGKNGKDRQGGKNK